MTVERHFQFHLSTLVMLLLPASLLLWANVTPYRIIEEKSDPEEGKTWVHFYGPGWPLYAFEATHWFDADTPTDIELRVYIERDGMAPIYIMWTLNGMLGLAFLALLGFVIERFHRRRTVISTSGQQGDPPGFARVSRPVDADG